tara:strand:+ start:410 stop:640 length:231 start_codon:yes stop_codon:yes gene_type:complete
MTKLEERITNDMLYYEQLFKDEQRFPDWDTRYDFEKVFDKLKTIKSKFNFVDDIRNEENLPEEGTIHYGESNVTPN